jgi:cytochrome P450
MTFKPERFFQAEGYTPEPAPHTLTFGFGRRICPGRPLADGALYINIAQTLAGFDISKPIENGQEVTPVLSFQAGVVSHPTPYKSAIRPRSEDP